MHNITKYSYILYPCTLIYTNRSNQICRGKPSLYQEPSEGQNHLYDHTKLASRCLYQRAIHYIALYNCWQAGNVVSQFPGLRECKNSCINERIALLLYFLHVFGMV